VKDIVLVVADLSAGGTQRVVTNLANYWMTHGKNITVITLAGPETDFFELSDQIQRIVIGRQADSNSFIGGIFANIRRVWALRCHIKLIRPDVCIGFIGQTNILLTLAGLGLTTRTVISERNDPRRQSLGYMWDILRRRIYPLAGLVTANSREVVKALETFVPPGKLAYLPNPVSNLDDELAGSDQTNKVIAIGRLHYQKGHDILIEAFANIAPRHPDWNLDIVGEGDMQAALQTQISTHRLEERITLTGRVRDVQNRLSAAKIFALPSRFEGTPNALLEALSQGLPAIVSDASAGALEFVHHQQNGLIVPVDDVDALSRALTHMIKDEALRQEFAVKSKKMVKKLSLPNVAAEWERVLQLPGPDTDIH
jgi:GalNAc-alpha-(1->4)-GalNAc-alpha-(1->3)-diNAcBac-PP-undecaprenol alpha-1,4-N-acetyl-D-galactosaminyltransferase